MKTILQLVFYCLTICVVHPVQAQINQPIPIYCNTDFWTITADGYIQQWSLSNGNVTGGDTILSGGGTSLAYCGNANTPLFYTNSYSPIGISYFNSSAGWINIPTYNVVNNNGGHLQDHYCMVEGAVIQVVKYFDGTDLLTIDSLNGEFFAGAHDIAVDTLGHAWVFTGAGPSNADSLKVYNSTGRITAYSIQFTETAYGSFFLNDTLYLGTQEGFIFPVYINGNMAYLGAAIPFPSNSFTDMASCQQSQASAEIDEFHKATFQVSPNPTTGLISLPQNTVSSNVMVYNSQGQLVNAVIIGATLDLSNQPSGVYIIQILTDGLPYFQKVMKL